MTVANVLAVQKCQLIEFQAVKWSVSSPFALNNACKTDVSVCKLSLAAAGDPPLAKNPFG